MKKYLLIIISALVLSSCAKQTFIVNNDSMEPTNVKATHFFLSGIGQEKIVNAIKVCGSPDKIAKVETQQTFVNVLASVFTFGIYTPREVRVFCKYNFS